MIVPKKDNHFDITSKLLASIISVMFLSVFAGILELLWHTRHFPALVIHILVAFDVGVPIDT